MKALWNKRREPAISPAACAPSASAKAPSTRAAAQRADAPLDSIAPQPPAPSGVTLTPTPPRLAPRALPQRRIVDMLQVTRLADEAANEGRLDEAAVSLQQSAANYPHLPGPLVRLIALGLRQNVPPLQAEHALGRICPAPADQLFAWLAIYGDRLELPTHRAYQRTLPQILARYADALSMPERQMLLTRAQTPTTIQPRTLLQRTLQAEAFGDGAGLQALIAFCPSFWEQTPQSFHDALEQALEIGARAAYRPLIQGGAVPQSPQRLALAALKHPDLAVFCAALRFDSAMVTTPFHWKRQHTAPVTLVQVAIELAGAQAGPFIEALGRFGACVMRYPSPSALPAPWRLAMQARGEVMRSFVDAVDDRNAVDVHTKRSLLMDAAYGDYPWAINLLIARGADAALRQDETGLTALDMAQSQGLTRCAGLLKDPTRTYQMLKNLVTDDEPDVQTELIACVAQGSSQARDAWYESMRQLYNRHGAANGALLSRIVLHATATARPSDILDYVSIPLAAPSHTSAKRMLEAMSSQMDLASATGLARQMRRHARTHRGIGRAMYTAVEKCVVDMPHAALDLLKNVAFFALRGASDKELADVLLGFLALARQPQGVGAWPASQMERCRTFEVSAPMRAQMIITSLAQTYRVQEALEAAKAHADKPDNKSAQAPWKRTFLHWARADGVKTNTEHKPADADEPLRMQAIQTLKQAAATAGRGGPMLVRGPNACTLADIEQVSLACHDENVVDFFDEPRLAPHVLALLQALLGDALLAQLFDADATQIPDARILRRLFLSMHPDRAPRAQDKPRFDAMTALLNEIYTWCKDAAAPKDAPPGRLILAYRQRSGASP